MSLHMFTWKGENFEVFSPQDKELQTVTEFWKKENLVIHGRVSSFEIMHTQTTKTDSEVYIDLYNIH